MEAKDPTENVKELVETKIGYLEKEIELRANFQSELDKKEAERTDALREQEKSNVALALERNNSQFVEFNSRITLLERTQYETQGKGSGRGSMGTYIFTGIMALLTAISILYGIFK